ncbi:MAG TPA: FCD domain-containing protein [Actinocrinis sp.]|nr:FCD domain-containing protein [Actinocrinis sp.]
MSLTEEAISRIKAMIVEGTLQPGVRLPKEDDLARELGLSRNSLREAVRALTAMNILVVKQGDGTYVSSLEPHLLMETLSFASDISQGETALQLLQTRRLLEPSATALAARLVTAGDLARLRAILDESERTEAIGEFIRLDMEFHRQIVDVIGNPVLSVLLQVLSTHTQRVRILRGNRVGRAIESVHAEHRTILAALEAGDPDLAAAAATLHVAAVERWLAQNLGDPAIGRGPEPDPEPVAGQDSADDSGQDS